MAKIIALVRDRENGDPVASEDVNFRNPGGTILDTDTTSADGSATYVANANPAGLITWDVDVSGETRKAGARAQRQIGPLFEAELAKSLKGIMSDGYSEGDGTECVVAAGSGRQTVVGTGCVWVQGIPFHFYTTTPLAHTANATLATRLDSVVLRVELDDSATTYGKGTLVVREGTVNNTPVTLASDTAGTYEYELARVTSALGFSSYTAGNISDQREQAGPYAVPVAALPSAIPATLIGNGSVTNAEFQTLSDISTITTVQAQITAKANIASPTFTGTPVLPGYSMTGNISTDGKTVTPANLGMLMNSTSELQAQINGKAATSHTHAESDVTNLVSDLAGKAATSHTHVMANITDLAAALALKAPSAGATLTGATVTASGGLLHTGGNWGFNGTSRSGREPDPDDVLTGTIDATWGTTEANILESIRTSFNQLVVALRNVGILSA
jgi:hypothetical protein